MGANLHAGFGYGLPKRLAGPGSVGVVGFQHATPKRPDSVFKVTTNDFGLDISTLANLFTSGVYYTLLPGAKHPSS